MAEQDMVEKMVVSSIATELCLSEEEILSNMDRNLDDYFSCDSLDTMDIVFSIEQMFRLKFNAEDIRNLHTARDIVAYVELKLDEKDQQK